MPFLINTVVNNEFRRCHNKLWLLGLPKKLSKMIGDLDGRVTFVFTI